ncbi:MAG TPA: hypothetical protein PL048_13015 [Leptospiraceae bacterium]|nr:hypothetical protein [Leptospiraceae bacterium]
MGNYNIDHTAFEKSARNAKRSIILSEQVQEHSYITLHERKEGRITGRKLLCQVANCETVYEAGLMVGEYYPSGQVPMKLPEFYLVEYVPMLTDKQTVLELKSTLESEPDLEAAHRYIFGA